MSDTMTADQRRDSIHRVLPGPKGNDWSTVQAVAEVVGQGYSTVTEHLRAMALIGRVESRKLGRNTVWRRTKPAPKLKVTDYAPPPKAAVVSVKVTAKAAPALKPRRRRPPVTRGLEIVELPADDVEPVPNESAELYATPRPAQWCTACGVSVDAPASDHRPGCLTAANTPAGGDVGSVVDYLESARPVSAAPAEPEKPVRARRAPKAGKTYAVFARGALQEAILTHLQALPERADTTPYQVAVALSAYPGAVAYGLDRLATKGNVTKTSDKPIRYAAV